MVFIEWPDLEAAKAQDAKYGYGTTKEFDHAVCFEEATFLYQRMNLFLYGHIFWCMITFYREIYEAKVGFIGSLMRFMEVLATMTYMVMITQATLRCVIYLSFDTI